MKAFLLAAAVAVATPATLCAQAPAPESLAASQREAMKSLDRMDGIWRGSAWAMTPAGRQELVQTERVGPFLGGAAKVIEGRGYLANGNLAFNALGIVSYDAAADKYEIRSYAMGRAGTFALKPTANGFTWEHPAGPGAVIRYTAVIEGDSWVEIGERVVAGQPPQTVYEMKLTRLGETDWPAAGAVAPR